MSLMKYEKYKESGVEWLGMIPEHWEVKRFKNIIKSMVGGGTPSTENVLYWDGDIPWVSAKDMKFDRISFSMDYITQMGVKESSTTLIKKNSILIVVRSGILKHTFPVSINVVPVSINQDLKALEPLKNVSTSFLFWYLKGLGHTILKKCNKVGATVDSLETQEFHNFPFLLFSSSQQTAIANYLDAKTSTIDKKINLLTKKIAHYQELRKSLINETVCRGLDKSVKLKESGIEWIGEVPEHWEVERFKDINEIKRGASPRPIDDPIYFDDNGEFSWVRIADLTASERYLETTKEKLSVLGASLSVKRYPNDFILSIAGTVGKPIITKIKCCIHDGFVWFPNLKLNPEFLYYMFTTGLPYQGLGKLGTQLNLNTETIGLISLPMPPKEEINKIVSYLDAKTQTMDNITNNLKKQIDTLKELRKTLINDVVTGKIKVI